ncbi:MAG: efflux RND transporter periplasmic adaptor subunit [Xanthobacteraceae bacterium]|nr:efflux RND transporter periplasmic adaptor subunit [Xanthobacteraceae bacterium]
MRSLIATVLAVGALLASLGAVVAHEGHDHDSAAPAARADAAPRGEAVSDAFELVAVAQGETLVLYLDRSASNEPVQGATLTVEAPGGPVDAEASGGAYRISAPWLAKPGHTDLIVTVSAGDVTDILPVSIDVPDRAAMLEARAQFSDMSAILRPSTALAVLFGVLLGASVMAYRGRKRAAALLLAGALLAAHDPASAQDTTGGDAGTDRAVRNADGSVFVPKPIQRIYALRTMPAASASHPRTVELPGRIIPDPNASGHVQASVGGRLSAPAGGFPRLGTPVKRGDVLAEVTPPIQIIDVSDMRQRQGELDQQIAILQRRVTRYEALAPSGAVSRVQFDEAKLELEGLKDRRASLDKVRLEPETLIAPVAGVIAEGTPVAGQMAQPNAVIFQIIDPAKLWIEALSFDPVAGSIAASAVTANGRTLRLSFRGSGLADRNQSIPVHFAIDGDASGLRAGQFLTVMATTGEQKEGIAIPRGSLVRGANGLDLVYVHTRAEQFEPRPVRVEPLDGERVLAVAGLKPGQRVVVQGAELLHNVR